MPQIDFEPETSNKIDFQPEETANIDFTPAEPGDPDNPIEENILGGSPRWMASQFGGSTQSVVDKLVADKTVPEGNAQVNSEGRVVVKHPETGKWHALEPKWSLGEIPAKLAQAPATIASLLGMAGGAAGGVALTAPTGPGALAGGTVGAAAGAAGVEAGRRALGEALGYHTPIGEHAAGVGEEALMGGAAELGGKLLVEPAMKAAGGVAKKLLGVGAKEVIPGSTAEAALAKASAATEKMMNDSLATHAKLAAAVEDQSIQDPLERLWAHERGKALNMAKSGASMPDYTINSRGEYVLAEAGLGKEIPSEMFKDLPQDKFNKLMQRLPDDAVRQLAYRMGKEEAFDAPSTAPLRKWLQRPATQDFLAPERVQRWNLLSETKGGVGQAAFLERTGPERIMSFSLMPPPTAAAASPEVISAFAKDLVEQTGSLDPLRQIVLNIANAAGNQGKFGRRRLAEISVGGFDKLVGELQRAGKAAFAGTGMTYIPAKWGLRTVWEVGEQSGWKSIALDTLQRVRIIDPATGKIAKDIDLLAPGALPPTHPIAAGIGGRIAQLGRGLQAPGRAVASGIKTLSEPLGLEMERKLGAFTPMASASLLGLPFGHPGAMATVHLTGDVLRAVGKRLQMDSGDWLTRAMNAGIVSPMSKAFGILNSILQKQGQAAYRSAAYVMAKQIGKPFVDEYLKYSGRKTNAVPVKSSNA